MRFYENDCRKKVREVIVETKTLSVGGGEWAKEFYGPEEEFLFEVIGENGTRCSRTELEESSKEMEKQIERNLNRLYYSINERINIRAGVVTPERIPLLEGTEYETNYPQKAGVGLYIALRKGVLTPSVFYHQSDFADDVYDASSLEEVEFLLNSKKYDSYGNLV